MQNDSGIEYSVPSNFIIRNYVPQLNDQPAVTRQLVALKNNKSRE